MKMENLFVTWQQRSAPASMPISVSSHRRLLHEDLWLSLGHCVCVCVPRLLPCVPRLGSWRP